MKKIKRLKKWIDDGYSMIDNKGKMPKGISIYDFRTIEDAYTAISRNESIEFISQTVHDVLEKCGITMEVKGIGWIAHR